MKKEELKKRLEEEVEKYSTVLSYAEAISLQSPTVVQHGMGSTDREEFYQVDVRLLDKGSWAMGEFAHVAVSVNDGSGLGVGPFRIITPEIASIFFYSDGRIEKVIGRVASARGDRTEGPTS